MKIAIIDYGMGNLRSVLKAVERSGGIPVITNRSKEIANSEKIIIPGVGHFKRGMQNLKQLGLIDMLNQEVFEKKKPILGICLGMQLMMEHSEEGETEGLSWFAGNVVRFRVSDKFRYKVPHIGWNSLNWKRKVKNAVLHNDFYFVHSYHVVSGSAEDVLATTTYDHEFVSAIHRENIIGYQFHPEKSHRPGLELLFDFINNNHV